MLRKNGLRYKFTVPTLLVVAGLLMINIVWAFVTQRQQAINEMKENGHVLTQQLHSTWEFMSINQDRINYSSDGKFDFKGLNCSTVGRSVGVIFAEKSGYVIRYVKENPRNPANQPDEFERMSLGKFDRDNAVTADWAIVKHNDERLFRYITPLRIDQTCLECHGDPAGEKDISGYPKEGMKLGSLAGAISIIMPADIYLKAIAFNMLWQCAFVLLLMIACVIAIYFLITKLITRPLGELETVIKQVEDGDLNIKLKDLKAPGEIKELANHFNDMARQLKNLYSDLENRVEQRTLELGKANEELKEKQIQLEKVNVRLEEDSQHKSDFLAIMSHELRTPLTAIIAFTEILETGGQLQNDNELNIINEIKLNSQILLGMINNTLEMARLETGKNELLIETVDMVDVINNVESIIRPLVHCKQINLTTNVDREVPLIQGDYEKIRRMVENLAGNAVKFTPDGGNIAIYVTTAADGQYVLVRVTDDGIGIDKAEQPYIFDKFYQVNTSLARKYSGSGLGLALAKQVADLHGGTITVESEPNKGSTFTISMPISTRIEREHNENNAGR